MLSIQKINHILNNFEAISLGALPEDKLMKRVDTKFIFPLSTLPQILPALYRDYNILEIKGDRTPLYKNYYYDTPDHQFYLAHHNKRDHRFKVRYRNYESTDTSFFEIKERQKTRTHKRRFQVDHIPNELDHREHKFIRSIVGDIGEINLALINSYKRITLINKTFTERLTIDLDLQFYNADKSNKVGIENVIIAELKQEHINKSSLVFKTMNDNGVRPFQFSKYCIGTVLLLSNKVKYNRFKKNLIKINSIENYGGSN